MGKKLCVQIFFIINKVYSRIILDNSDSFTIQSRISLKEKEQDLTEQTLSQALKAAKEQISKTILS